MTASSTLTKDQQERSLILLDVDGVLNIDEPVPGPGRSDHLLLAEGTGAHVTVRDNLSHLLERLAVAGDLLWASGWNDAAPLLFAQLVPWLRSVPHLTFAVARNGNVEKLSVVMESVGERSLVWIDDRIPKPAWEWAEARGPSTLLLPVDPAVGLTEYDVEIIERWAQDPTIPETTSVTSPR